MAAAGFHLIPQDEERAEQIEATALEENETAAAARSIHRLSDMQTRLKPKLTMRGICGGLGATALLAFAAVATWRKGGTLQPNLHHAVLLQQEGKDCVDIDPFCPHRAMSGQCNWNPEYMDFACRATCGSCPKARAFLPTVYDVSFRKNPRPSPDDCTQCTTIHGVPQELVECPAFVTVGNGVAKQRTKDGFKLAVQTYPASSSSTHVCVISDPDISTGWDTDISFKCQAKAVLVDIGCGPGESGPYTQCVTPPVLPANCPATVTRNNRVPRDGEPDEFRIQIINGQVCATGDRDWHFNLAFFCQAGLRVDAGNTVRVQFGEARVWKESCTKCIRPKKPVDCPTLVSEINWATPDEAPEVFSITKRSSGEICATRVDTIGQCDSSLADVEPEMWGTDLAVYCKGEPITCSCVNPAEYNTFVCDAQVSEGSCGEGFACTTTSKWHYEQRYLGATPACAPRQ